MTAQPLTIQLGINQFHNLLLSTKIVRLATFPEQSQAPQTAIELAKTNTIDKGMSLQ